MRLAETGAAFDERIRLHVTSGAAIIAASATQARMYRVFGLDEFATQIRAAA
jgi:hypothetical protein